MVFKARPFNAKLFSKRSIKLPSVDRKEGTHFETFTLSNSNALLAKKTLSEYVVNKENPGLFKALSLDRKMLEKPHTPHKEKLL